MAQTKAPAKKTVLQENVWLNFDKDIHKLIPQYEENFAQEGHTVVVQYTCIAWPSTVVCPTRYLYRIIVDLVPVV